MTLDSDKTLVARLAAIARKLETITGSPAPAALERDFTPIAQLKRIEDAVEGGVFTAHSLGAHTDTQLTSPIDGAFLRYDTGLGAWKDATAALTDLSDQAITSPAAGQFLRHNGSVWANAPIAVADLPLLAELIPLYDLSDVQSSGLTQDKQVLRFRSSDSRWINQTLTLNQGYINDVLLGGIPLATGQTMIFDSTTSQWKNNRLQLNGTHFSDVTVVPTSGRYLRYNTPFWVDSTIQLLSDVADVEAAPADQHVLMLDFASGPKFVYRTVNELPLDADWNMGNFNITADRFLSSLDVNSTQKTCFSAVNNVAATALAGGTTYRGYHLDLDYVYNGIFTNDTIIGQRLDFLYNVTAGTSGATVQPIDVDATISAHAQAIPAFDYRVTASNSGATFGAASAAAFFVQATAGGTEFNGLRSEANASSAAAGATNAVCGYLGFASGANTYTGNLVGIQAFTANITGANGVWGLLSRPGASGGTINQDRRVAVGGINGHFHANGGSLILESSVGSTFRRPADVTTTHLNFNTNYGQLYVQGASEFDGTVFMDGALDHNGSTLGFYSNAPVARPAAYTQTYATATRTHANLTSATLTDSTGGTANTTVVAIAGTGDDANLNNNFADLIAQCNALRVDLANAKQVLNQVLDDLQLIGLLQ